MILNATIKHQIVIDYHLLLKREAMNSMNSSASEPSLSSKLATKNHLASKCFRLAAILQQLCVWLIQSDFIKVVLCVPCTYIALR